MKVDVIIPTYKPDKGFPEMIKRLEKQTLKPNRIIIMNTEEKYFEKLLYGTDFAREHPEVEVHHLSKREFNHGGTRHLGALHSSGDIFVCMTQDALPADNRLLEELTAPFLSDDRIAVSYARQLPEKDSGEIERFTRAYNYPEESCVKGKEQLSEMGIKTYFCSNVCAAYKKDIYQELGGFVRHTIFNEDMIYAGNAVLYRGQAIAYVAEARVIHSHNYGCSAQLKRNFDLAVSQTDHPEVFDGIRSESEGIRLVKKTCKWLVEQKKPWLIPGVIVKSGFKYLGYLMGKRYRKLPRWVIMKITMNREYWGKVSG